MADNKMTPADETSSADTISSDRLGLLKQRLATAKSWQKRVHKSWKKYISEYEIEDIADVDEIRDKVRIGYIFRHVESDIPSIFDDQPDLFFTGRNPQTQELEKLFTATYDWLWNTQRLDETVENAAMYFDLLGMGFVKSPWVTKTKKVTQTEQVPFIDENGQPIIDPQTQQPQMEIQEVPYDVPTIDNPLAEVADPFKIYFSPETKFNYVLDYKHCPYYFEEEVLTTEAVKALYNKTVDATDTLKIDADADENPLTRPSRMGTSSTDATIKEYEDDIKRVKVYHYYGILPEDKAEGIKDQDGKAVEWEYDKDYHIVMTVKEELLVENCQYPTKPLFVLGNYGLANKFFKFGDARHLMPLVSELEQYRTQILKHTRKMANPKLLVPQNADLDEKALRNPNSGVIVKYLASPGIPAPNHLNPAQLGQEVEVGITMARTDLEQTSGQFNLAQGSGVSQVKTPRGIQTYSEAADKNIRRKKKKVSRFIRELIIFQFKLLSMYWKPEDGRTIEVMDEGKANAVSVTTEILEILGSDDILAKIDIETDSLAVNQVQIKQDSLDLFDLASKFPYIFNLDAMGKDLLQNGFRKKDADRYLATDAQKQQYYEMAKLNKSTVRVSVAADAATPSGAQILEAEQLLQPGLGQQAAQASTQQKIEETQAQQQGEVQANGQKNMQDLQKQVVQQSIMPKETANPTQKGGQHV